MRILRWVVSAVAALLLAGVGAYAGWQYLGRDRERAQTPRSPLPYASEEVALVASDGVRLAGTLSIPRSERPVPAVVVLGVAGPNDRDLTFRGHKSFAVIADALARCGVAALRFDDRGVGGSGGHWLDAPYATLVADALAARASLAGDARIDPARTGLVGLSEGAAIVLLGAAQSKDVAFAVLMSPPGLRGDAALRAQFETMLSWSPMTARAADGYRASFARFIALSRSATDEGGRKALAAFLQGEGAALVPAYGFVPPTVEGRVRLFSSPWYRSQLDYDPAPALAALTTPVLVVSGTLDQVLPPRAHVPPIKGGLRGRPATFVAIEGANHLLMPSWTGLPLEYAQLETTVDPLVLSKLCAWIPR